MLSSSPNEKYAASAASVVVEDISERVRQLTRQIHTLQQTTSVLSASTAQATLPMLRQRIQANYQEILRLEKEKARSRNRGGSYLSVVLSVATCDA